MAALGVAPLIFVNNHALHLDSMTELYFYFLYESKGVKWLDRYVRHGKNGYK